MALKEENQSKLGLGGNSPNFYPLQRHIVLVGYISPTPYQSRKLVYAHRYFDIHSISHASHTYIIHSMHTFPNMTYS